MHCIYVESLIAWAKDEIIAIARQDINGNKIKIEQRIG